MRKGRKVKIKSKITYMLPVLVLFAIVIGIVGVTKVTKNLQNNNLKGSDVLTKQENILLNQDDENLLSDKYLVTDNTIEKIKENTTIEELKSGLNKEVIIYRNNDLTEELKEGKIITGMVAEDKSNNIYNLIVSGDVNEDGIVDQIDITKIMRKELKDDVEELASKFGKENIAKKIVYGEYNLGDVNKVKSPEIQIVNGEKGENDNYISDVEIKIAPRDEEEIKTVYKITGAKEQSITQITPEESINLTQDGVYKIISYTYGKQGNRSNVAVQIVKVNKTGIIPTISYSTEEPIVGNVTATVSFNKSGITITNNDGKNTYEFTENGSYTFEYKDEAGRIGNTTAEVTWIRQPEIIGKDGEWKYFVRKDGTIQLTRYLGTKTEITVPAIYDEHEVYSVGYQGATSTKEARFNVFGENSSSNTTVTKLILEEGIKEIGISAFANCTQISNEIIFPSTLKTMGDCAFLGCSKIYGNLDIPDLVEYIGVGAFQNCQNLTGKLTLSNSLVQISDYAFNGCKNLTGSLVIPNSVRYIGRTAFQNCSKFAGELVIQNGVNTIGEYAFNKCSGFTGDLNIPDSVTSIGKTAFQSCSGFNGNLKLPQEIKEINDNTFNGCSNLIGNLTIPNNVTAIGKVAFENCSKLNGTLTLSNTLKTIGDGAFNNCSSLVGDLIIPNNVTAIGNAAFQNCSKLNGTLTLSNTLKTIGDGAFNNCSNLVGDLIIPDTVIDISYISFQNLTHMTGILKLSKNVKNIGPFAFYDNKFTGNLEFPEGLETIGQAAFGKSTNFSNVKILIPSTLEKIGIDCEIEGQNIGISTHDFYNFGANAGSKFEAFEVAPGNEYFVAIDGVLYTKDQKRLIAYPKSKKDTTYEIKEGVLNLDELSIASNMSLQTLILPDSLSLELRPQGIRFEGSQTLTPALYTYNAIQNIETKETNPNYKSVDGVVYTKDLKEMVYVSSGRTNAVTIPDGVETIRDEAVYLSQVGRSVSEMYIPESVTTISDDMINRINGFIRVVKVSPDNPNFTVNDTNKLVRK